MKNLGYTLEPFAGIDLIVFPCFANETVPVQIVKIDRVKESVLTFANTKNMQKIDNNFDYLDRIPCYKIKTFGINCDFIKNFTNIVISIKDEE
jgi:hypothetical protein